MFETLSARLEWDRTEEGIRVVIPSWFNWWSLVFSGLGVLMIPHFTYEIYWKTVRTAGAEPRSFIPEWIGLALFLLWLASFRTHKSVLTLTAKEMRVEARALGLALRTAASSTRQVSDLRFIPPGYGVTADHQSKVQVRVNNAARRFGIGIGEEEAHALIAEMMKVYPFRSWRYKAPLTCGVMARINR